MNTTGVRFVLVNLFILILSLGVSVVVQAESSTSMMGRGEHGAMMGYGSEQSKTEESEEQYEQMPYGWGMGYGQMGPGMMGYGQMGPGMMGYGHMGSGMMDYGHMGSGMMGGMRYLRHLDLTDEQERKIRAIHSRLRRENWAQMGDMLEQQDKLAELYSADTPDPKAIGKVYAAIFDIKRQKIEKAISAHNEVRALLTEEQRKSLEQGRGRYGRHRKGCGYMW